jgi:hypothetical protein
MIECFVGGLAPDSDGQKYYLSSVLQTKILLLSGFGTKSRFI